MNKCMFAGRISREIELQTFQTGSVKATFSVLVSNGKKKDGSYEESSFFNCVAWGKQADAIQQWFPKGRPIIIAAEYRRDTWNDSKTGEKRSRDYFLVREFWFVPHDKSEGSQTTYSGSSHESGGEVDFGDVPF